MTSRRLFMAQAAGALCALGGCASLGGEASTGANRDLVVLSVGISYAQEPNGVGYLPNPPADADLVGSAFSRIRGADVTVLIEPLDISGRVIDFAAFQWATDGFIDRARGKTAVLYYAGHGFQFNGENYLVLGDGATLVPVIPFLDELNAAADTVVVFFDACRDNPFAKMHTEQRVLEVRGARSSGDIARYGHPEIISLADAAQSQNGLARLSRGVGEGAMVVFATQAGEVALDGVGKNATNSPFARAVARNIGERRRVTGVVGAIQTQVLRETSGEQNPVAEDALGGRPVFLAGQPIMPS